MERVPEGAPAPQIVRVPDQYGHPIPSIDLPLVRNVLVANPDLNVMFNMTDLTADAVKQTGMIDASGNSKVIIGGFDGQVNVVKLMRDQPNFGSVATALNQPPIAGAMALQEAVSAIKGKPPVDCQGSPPTCVLKPGVATASTAAKYYQPQYHNAYDAAQFKSIVDATRRSSSATNA
ncbi:MAG: rbsB [Conexibacter sp.]|nr:rbsB [Conexibacter sp.]